MLIVHNKNGKLYLLFTQLVMLWGGTTTPITNLCAFFKLSLTKKKQERDVLQERKESISIYLNPFLSIWIYFYLSAFISIHLNLFLSILINFQLSQSIFIFDYLRKYPAIFYYRTKRCGYLAIPGYLLHSLASLTFSAFLRPSLTISDYI